MATTTDSQYNSENSITRIAEVSIASAKEDLAYAYRKAMWALYNYFPSGELLYSDFTETSLRDWVSSMLCHGITVSMAKYYLENIAAIYNKGVKAGETERNGAFKVVKEQLGDYLGGQLPVLTDKSFGLLGKLINGVTEVKPEFRYFADLFLFSFYMRGMSAADILLIEKGATDGMPQAALDIAARYSDPRRKRLFPRGKAEDIERKILMLIHHLGFDIPHSTTLEAVAGGLWINAAMRLGIPPSAIRGCMRGDLSGTFAVISFASEEPIGEDRVEDISEQVIQSVTCDPQRWHVMKLRSHVSYEELLSRVGTRRGASTATTSGATTGAAPATLPIETFYPIEEIRKKVGKKVEKEQRPVLPDIVFFRCADSALTPLFRNIGDIAWCYRTTRQGSYAIVSQAEMDNFQRTIAIFTPDFDVEPLGTTDLKDGQRVRVTGGQFAGYEGIVGAHPNVGTRRGASTAKPVTFTLRIMADNGLEWTVEIDPRLLEPIKN